MEPEKRHRVVKYSLATIAILVALAFCAGIIYAIADYYANDPELSSELSTTTAATTDTTAVSTYTTAAPRTTVETDAIANAEVTGGDILDYYPQSQNDGLFVTFSHGANSVDEMEAALADENINILEADVTLRFYGFPNQTEEPIMAHPPMFNSDNTLYNWLETVIASKKAIKLDMKIEDVVPYALKELRTFSATLNQTVWINADVLTGPNTQSQPIDGVYFIQKVNEYFPNATLSLGWTTGYRIALENEQYSWESMDSMLELARSTLQRITFPIRASLARDSWNKFLWLVEQDDRFSLTVWSPTTDPVPLEDRIYLRDNLDPAKLFYDTASPNFVESIKMEIEGNRTVEKTFYTGGNVLDFFRTPDRDAINITWAHRANKKTELKDALEDDSIMMLEADVRLNTDGIPVMAHTTADIPFSDQTLQEWLQAVVDSGTEKGMKLDVKTTNTLVPSFETLRNMSDSIKVPVWLNSDVLPGPNSVTFPVNATTFFESANAIFRHSTLSPGWTTAYNPVGENELYTQEMVEEMYAHCKNSRQAITFPVRASLTGKSIAPLQWLLNKSNR